MHVFIVFPCSGNPQRQAKEKNERQALTSWFYTRSCRNQPAAAASVHMNIPIIRTYYPPPPFLHRTSVHMSTEHAEVCTSIEIRDHPGLTDSMSTHIPSLEYSKQLSSNWKKLQETLKKDTSRPPKRKASQAVLRSDSSKRLKQLHIRNPNLDESCKSSKVETMDLTASVTKKTASSTLAEWAEDNGIPAKDLVAAYGKSLKSSTSFASLNQVKENVNEGLSSAAEAGKFIAIDCEMVGVGPNPDRESALARISIVDYNGHQLYDSFVLPKEPVTDYRTHVSGITPQLLRSARTLEVVQTNVAKLFDGRILVGHAIKNDLNALLLGHPKRDIRDTSKYPPYRALSKGRSPALKKLAQELLGIAIQGGQHSSVEDARATMLLFRRDKEGIEKEHVKRWGTGQRPTEEAKDPGSTNHRKKGKKGKKAKKVKKKGKR